MNWSTGLGAKLLDRLPKVVGPRGHTIMDYVVLGGTIAAAVVFYRRNRTASAAAILAAAAQAVNVAITDYPGGFVKLIRFPMHGRVDLGLAGMVASVPQLMSFDNTPERQFFRLHSMATLALAGVTDFTGAGDTRPQVPELAKVEA